MIMINNGLQLINLTKNYKNDYMILFDFFAKMYRLSGII